MRSVLGLGICLPLVLAGCAISPTAATSPDAGLAIQGIVRGGQQPIVGAHVYLFAANTTGYGGAGIAPSSGNASISLLNAPGYVVTDANGGFNITGDYTCTQDTQVYMYAVGGNPGAGVNNAAGLLAVLGNCPSTQNFLTATPYIVMNEVSTVAAAYAFAGFASDATHVSSSNTALAKVGIKNAFANAANLATLSTGAARATPANGSGSVPQDEIYALADILASCINSNGAITSGPPASTCYTLLNNAQSAGSSGTIPTDTATAAINIAHNPGSNVAALFGLAAANPPFVTSFAQPNDFTIAVQLTGGGVNDPNALAIDGSGNVWTTNNNNTVSQISSMGSAVSASPYSVGGLNGPNGIAIDTSGNAWIANYSGNSVTELTSSGISVAGSPFNSTNMSGPYGIAIDGTTGYVWVTNALSPFSVTKLSSTGTPLSGSTGYTTGGLAAAYSIAIDHSGNAWVANNTNSSVTEYSSAGALLSSTGYVGGGLNRPRSIAIDASGNAWIADDANLSSQVTELKNDGTAISTSSGYMGGGLNGPYAIAIDGAGNAWIGNYGSNSVSELAGANGAPISPASTGYVLPNALKCVGIALDGSGDVWIADPSATSVTELIGAATPVVTPLSVAAMNGTLGTRP